MRLTLLSIPAVLLLAACGKSQSLEERWLEKSQRKEVIVFRHGKPDSSDMYLGEERSFYFQARPLPPSSSRANESGIYFYSVAGDSLILKTRQEKYYFHMSSDGRSFTIGRFFADPGGLGDLVTFEKQ